MKYLNLLVLLMMASHTWGVPPKVSQPSEGAKITTNQLLLFIYPTPVDVREKRWLGVEVLEKTTGNKILSNLFAPVSNYRVTLKLNNITNGEYTLKTFYADKKGDALTGNTLRNFTLSIFK